MVKLGLWVRIPHFPSLFWAFFMLQKTLKLILLTNLDLNSSMKALDPNSEKTGVRAYLTLWYGIHFSCNYSTSWNAKLLHKLMASFQTSFCSQCNVCTLFLRFQSVVVQKSWACQTPSTFESSRIIIIPSYSIVWEKWLSSHRRSSLGASRNFACPRKLHRIEIMQTVIRR